MPPPDGPRLVERVHRALSLAVGPGDRVIDATAGNGHDTLHLARLVGPAGHVLALDIQQAAIDATRARLEAAGCAARVDLVRLDHAGVGGMLATQPPGGYSAVVFNLGYLPGSGHEVATRPATTIPALTACAERLSPGGLLCVTAYRGHPGGEEEAAAVAALMDRLAGGGWTVRRESPGDPAKRPPVLWIATPC